MLTNSLQSNIDELLWNYRFKPNPLNIVNTFRLSFIAVSTSLIGILLLVVSVFFAFLLINAIETEIFGCLSIILIPGIIIINVVFWGWVARIQKWIQQSEILPSLIIKKTYAKGDWYITLENPHTKSPYPSFLVLKWASTLTEGDTVFAVIHRDSNRVVSILLPEYAEQLLLSSNPNA